MTGPRETFVGNVKAHLAFRRTGYYRSWLACATLLAYGVGLLFAGIPAARVAGVLVGGFALILVVVLLLARRWYFPTRLPNGLLPPPKRWMNTDRGSRLSLAVGAGVFVVAAVVAAVSYGTTGIVVALLALGVPWLVLLASAVIGFRTRARSDEIYAEFLRAHPEAGVQLAALKRAWTPDRGLPFD